MKLVYLKRAILINKVCKKTIPKHLVFVLYLIHIMQPVGSAALYNKFYFIGRSARRPNLTNQLKDLVNDGYITRDNKNKYNVTASGLEALKDVERRLRIERYDR